MKIVTSRDKVIYALKSYHQLKANIEVSEMNIKFLKSELEKVKKGEISLIEHDNNLYKTKTCFEYMYISETEKEVFRNQTIQYADMRNIQERISKEEGILEYYKGVVKLIDTSINTLFDREKFIIEMLYKELIRYNWSDIETSFEKKYKVHHTILTLQKYRDKAMLKLIKIMGNNYLINYLF